MTGPLVLARRLRRRDAAPLLFAAVLALCYVVIQPKTGDLAAQTFRSGVVSAVGMSSWNNFWYGGHHLPGYSVLFPVLGAAFTPVVAGAVAAFTSVATFFYIVRGRSGRAVLATFAFSVGIAANLLSGRLTFLLGVAFGLGALAAALDRRILLAGVLGVATGLASPIAGAFLALAGLTALVADWRDARTRWIGTVLIASPAVVVGANMRMFPEGGTFPFTWSDIIQAVLVTVLAFAVIPRDARYARDVRIGLALYLLACVAAAAIPSPMGANATRFGTLFVVPIIVAFAENAHRVAALGVIVFALVWQWEAPVRDVSLLHRDPSLHEAYYTPLTRYLDTLEADGPFRVEIPPTANHWEAAYVGADFPLARGWERQLDRKYGALFYDGAFGATRYERWLQRNGVGYVAVPRLALPQFDFAAREEVAFVRAGTPTLERIWKSRDWQVYRVVGADGLSSGPGAVTALSMTEFTVRLDRPGELVVRIHWSPNLHVAEGEACLTPSPAGWTSVASPHVGTVRIGAGIDVTDALSGGGHCSANDRSSTLRS